MAVKFRLHHWPILTAIWMLCTFLTSYLVAVFDDHVFPLFPYISDTGTTPPESCIFGLMLNFGAFFLLITVYIRHRTVLLIEHRGTIQRYKLWNNWSNFFGILCCLGVSLVANFQETSEINVHFVGAFLAFAIGAVYCIIQAYLTWLTYASSLLKWLRIFVSCMIIPFYIVTTVLGMISFRDFEGDDQFKWGDNEKYYSLHLAATFSEWIMSIFLIVFIITFSVELKKVELKEITFVLNDK